MKKSLICIPFSIQIIEHFLIEKCLSSNTKPFESKAFELNLDYSFVATSVPQSVYDTTDSKRIKKISQGQKKGRICSFFSNLKRNPFKKQKNLCFPKV